ncbi:MAG: ABC transporter substrate-binding protein [Chloroflexota bacterium]
MPGWRQDNDRFVGEAAERRALWETLRGSAPAATRRDMLRWSAILAGAAATARFGIGGVAAAPPAQDAPVVQDAVVTVPFDAYGEPVTLDPHRSADFGGFWVAYPNVWAGLLGYDENGRVVRDLAADAVVSEDGLVYTFTLREGLVYASGNPVLSTDFVASWLRALDPANPSPMAGFMRHVAGYDDWLAGVPGAALGFNAPDDRTVEVILGQPVNYFPSYLAAFVWAVVDPAVLATYGEPDFVLNGAGAGPWTFDSYVLDEEFSMVPNPNHFNGPNPSIAQVRWPILTGPDAARAALDLYIAGEAVSADVPLSLKAEVEADPALSADLVVLDQRAGSVRSLAMDFRQPPFDDVRVRRAFALAMDRQRYAEIYENTWRPAESFSPPVLQDLAGYDPPKAPAFDVEAGRALIAEAGYSLETWPDVIYMHPAEDSDEEKDRVRNVLDMLGRNLGVTLLFDDTRTLEQIAEAQAAAGGRQFDIIGWQNVADTPHLLTEVFSPDSPYMLGVFNWAPDNPPVGEFAPGDAAAQFAALVAQADLEVDPAARNDLFRQAEQLMLDNAVYIPIANWAPMFLQRKTLKGARHGSWTGRLPVIFDNNVVVTEG